MAKYTVIKQVQLKAHHRPTGKTHHYLGNQELVVPSALCIAKYQDDPGYYLLYFDAHDRELTDTYHDSLEAAMAQAEWEFQVHADEWQDVAS